MARMIPEPPVATRNQDKVLARVGENEPIFVLRAQDLTAAPLILEWLTLNPQIDKERRREVFDIYEQFLNHPKRHRVS